MEKQTKQELETGLENALPKGAEIKTKIQSGDLSKDLTDPTVAEVSQVYSELIEFISTQFVNNVELIKQPIMDIVSFKDIVNFKYRIEYHPAAPKNATPNGELPAGDTTIEDFTGDKPAPFTAVYSIDKQIYEKRDFDANAFFDFMKTGGGLSIIVSNETKNIKNVIGERMAGDVYAKLLESETINNVVGVNGLDTLQIAKLIRLETINTETPSRDRVSGTYNGNAYSFMHQANSTDYDLIIDTNYENDKAFDIDGTKFNVGQYSISYASIKRLNFAQVSAEYGNTMTNYAAFLVEKGAIMGAMGYEISQILKKPRFKTLHEWALRYGFDKKLDKFVVAFDKTQTPTVTPETPKVHIIDDTPVA